jgi:hypothetical protein
LKKLAIRDFYLSPGYLLRRAVSVKSLSELVAEAREGLSLVIRNL